MPFNTHKRQHYSITHHYFCPLKPFMKASRPTCNIWGRSLNVTFPLRGEDNRWTKAFLSRRSVLRATARTSPIANNSYFATFKDRPQMLRL